MLDSIGFLLWNAKTISTYALYILQLSLCTTPVCPEQLQNSTPTTQHIHTFTLHLHIHTHLRLRLRLHLQARSRVR